jgi:hypothetical protein
MINQVDIKNKIRIVYHILENKGIISNKIAIMKREDLKEALS